MPTPDKIDQLYDALKADGAVSKSRENFRSYMLASGEQGYRNRKQLYDALKADGAVESATYEEFRDRLGLHAVKPQQPVAKPSSTPRSAQQPSKPQKAKQQPKKTAWKPTPAQQLQFQQTINSVQQTIQNVNERHKNMAEYSKQRMKHPFGQRGGLAFGVKNKGALTPFDSKNLVQGRDEYNPKTGKFEPTYITAAGNKYSSRLIANSEQRQIDDAMERELHPIETQLRDAYAERDRLNKLAQERVDELEREYEERPWYTKLGEYANSDKMPDAGSPMLRWDNDMQYKQYMAALRKNRALITTLKDKKSGKMNEFWHTLGNEITNGYTFSLAGKAQLDDMAALTFAQKHVDAINKKRQKGEALTKEEQAAEAVLKNAEWDNRVQSQYGDEYGAWARAGKMGAVSLDLMVDFALMGGQPLSLAKTIAGGTGKLATKLVGKAATKGFGKYMVKATGATLGSMVAGAEIANTIGIGRTMSDAAGRYQGDVILDENGDYVFGHFEDDGKGGQKLVKGGDSFIGAVLGAERTAIAENGSEIAGAFLPGGKILLKGMEKIGLSKIASGLTSLSGRQWYAAYSRALQTAGFNGVPGEALEEYVGTGFDALMGGEEWKNLADKRTHVDIWLGCATMGALLNAPRIVGTGFQMAQYYRYKHNTDKSDRLAEIRLGNEAWEPLRQQIDEATNGQITDVLVNVLDNENLNEEQRKAVAEYAVNLQRMRGYSLGRVSSEERDDEHQPTQRELDEQTLEQSYTQGYGATDIADMQDIKHGMDYQHERVASFADANLMSLLDGSPMDAIDAIRSNEQLSDEQKQIAIDYVKARNTHNALLQRINDDADSLAEEDREQSKQMQHTDGSFHTAILKEKDGEGNDLQVYIVDGNVQMMPDGSTVDKAASDNIVVVYNPATGERKQIDPSSDTGISSLGEVITAEEYDAGIEQKRQEYVKTMMDDVNGIIHPEVGQQVVYNGEPVTVTGLFDDGGIVASREDGTVITASHEELQQEADEISYADYLQRNGNEVEQADTNTSIPVTDTQKTVINGAPTEYNEGMELTIRDEDGTEKPAMVMGRVRYENGSFIPDANGSIVEYESNGETRHDHITALGDKVVSHTEERTVPTEMPQYSLDDDVYLQTEDGEIHGNVIAEENPDGLITIQSEQPIGGRIVNQFTREQLDGMTGNNAVENIPPQVNISGENIPQEPVEAPVTPSEPTPVEQPTAEPMPVGEDGEEDWQATTPERAHAYIFNEAGLSRSEGNEFIAAQTQAAQSALVKAKSAQMPRVGTSIKKYNEAKAKRQEKIDEAQRVLDYWQQVRNIQNDIQRVENERRAAEDAVRHDEAVAEAQAEYEARKQAEAERKAVGNENPMPAITEKWNNATKVDGHRDEIMLPDGTPLKGHYVLHESGASSPSHNPETWQKTDGFPMDANDNSVNDRDYERDHDAQEHTQSIARQYDQRALQSVPVVSNDGVVLSGNGRTMAGELAARDNTDGAYVNYLKEYAPKFGFTPEQVEAMQHPRVSFVPDEAMPYTAETFAKFNQQEMKSQNKTEQAVKLGKTVSDDSFKGIVRTINGYDTLGDFYNDAEASLGAVYDLHNAGVVPQAQLAEMVDGIRGQEKLSAVGREFLENMLIGKAFESDPEVVRMLTAEPAMRQTVITALGEIVDNIALGGDWSLQGELADAVKLCFDARQGGAKYGEIVSTYARQGVLFADPDELQTVADFNNATMLMLADVLNDKRVTLLKTTLQLYNNNARQSAVGQADLFAGGIQSREDILRDVITFINENYGKRKEIEAARAEAVERRKAESVQQDGTPPAVSTDGEATAEPSAEPAPVEAEPVEATEPVEAEPNAVQTALAAAEQETNTEPTEAQKEAGNYKKGHVKIDGYDVTIENPKGSVRRGTDASGKQWEQEMQNTYGYIRGTEGVDGDHIDVFFSEDPSQGDVFVVDQVNKDGSFDEHKVMYGFPDIESARKAYLSNYEDGWQGLGAITPVSKEEFKKWIDSSHRKTKPFAEYSSVKPLGDTQLGEKPTAGYSIEPTTYTNKKGKTTPMHLVTFGRELSKDEIRAGKELAKESRGWWDREKGGFMMRDEDSAKALAEALSNEEAVQDAQPLSVEDVATVSDQADMKAVDETIKVEQEPQTTPQYDYEREDDVYDKTLTGLRNVLNDRKRGAIPNIKSIENVIRDLRKRAKTIEDGMATAAGETIPQAFDALANLNGRRKAYEQFLVDIRKRMAEDERDDALAAHGVKLGDKVKIRGKEATIHDADARQVTLDTGMAPVLYEVTDWENVEVPKREPATPQPKKVNVESLMGELNEKGEAKLSDHTEEQQQEESTEQPKQEEKKGKSKWVDDADAERFEELRRRLRQKLGGQLNMGVDPEAFALGVEMSYLMLKHGARKFAEFAKLMIEALGENVRPYLKSFYNGARDLPEMAEYEKELTPYDEVRTFDVMNFDKEGAKDIVATAEHIVREQAAEREAKEATDKLKQERNEQRKETEQEVAANTEALASEAATVASEVESKLPSARSEREVNDLAKNIDDAIDKVNDQLALLGYYEAEPVESDFNEAYGYMRNAEKKAVKNVTELFKTLTKELGISDPVVYDTKGKKQKSVTANIAPAGGDVTMRFMLNRDKDVELYIDFMLEPDYENNRDNLVLKGIMFRPEKSLPNGGRDYLRANNFFPVDVTMPQMLHGIRSVCQEWLPAEDYVAMAQRIAAENAGNQKEKASKGSKSKKKSVSLHEQTIPDLFSGLFGEDELNSKDNDTARTDNTKGISREDGSVGSVPADRDGVLDTRSTGGTERGETTGVSDETGAVADGTRTGVPGRRSSGSAEGGDNLASEAGQPLSERGQRVRDRADEDGRSAIAGTADESQGTSQPTGRRGNVKSSKQPEPKFTRNYLYPEDASAIDNMTPQQRLSANVEALEVVRTLMKEGREATPEEREILGKYRGWGGVELGRAYSTDMMRRSFTDRWGAPTEQGKLLGRLADVIDELDPKGERGVLSAINRAALTSYYTPTGIAKVMNRFAELAGFKGGSMLDPSMGNGVFEGTMSKGVQQRTMIHGIELDWLTGQIARNLYPDANVLVTGYEQAGTADNAYDVVMSNIPFGSISVTDKSWKHDSSPVRKAAQGKIHNYFAVKMLDNTRPGGLCVIMTSNAILDTKGNQIIREHLADQAEVLGVVRLPDNTFKGAGTSVVTDVIFLRKYKDDADRAAIRGNEDYTANIEKPFLSSGELQLTNPTDGKTYKVTVNGYFTKNKGMMIGDAKAGGQYRADEFGLGSNLGTDELAKAMSKIVEKKIVGDRKGKLFDTHKTEREVHQAVSEAYKGDGNFISSGNIVEQDGMFGIVTSNKNKYGDVTSTFNEMPSLKAKASRIRAMLPIREAMKELIAAEIGGTKEDVLKELRKKLQGAYDAYVKKFGHLNNKENDFLIEDIDGYTLRSLERWKDGKFDGLSDIFTKNTIKPALDLSTAKTPADAISLSLAEYGEINPSFMEDVLGESWAEQCGETLFRTPFTEDVFETADAYLSGDVKTKLEQAREAAKQDKSFERNVEALEAVQPKDIPFEDISIRMGARWIPAEVYTDFMFDMFGIRKNDWKGNKSGVEYMPEVDQYVVNVANNELGGEADAWRTSRRAASEVFTAALQDKSLSVFDTIKEDGKEIKVLNKEETELLNNKIQDLRTEFEDWLSQNPEREEMLMRLYNDKFNRTVLRKFDGSHLNVAGLMGKELRPHQKDAVWMLINNRGGIVDHIVGAGKTLVMQSAIMEMRRMGIAKKPMIIGLKATVAQIAKEFREAYPAARILAPTEKDFSKENRKRFMSQIALNDYDCVILSHDQYCMLPHIEEVERGVIDEQMMQLDAAIEYLYGQSDKNQLTKKQIKGQEKRKANLEAKLDKLLDRKIDREFTFEGLGVDYLFVDECQHFKSLPYVSTYDRVAGLGDKQGSQRAIALLNGVRYLQRMHQGDRGTVFLSGTTISNSLSEIYHLLNYLRPSEMERLGMTTFDAWAGNYAIHTAELEYGVTNELKEKDRFRSLTNIPELSKMYAEIADVRNDLNLKLPKPKMRSHVVTVPQSDIMQEINREIVNMVKNKDGSYFGIDSKDTTPWGLLASTLSAKAAINPRLIDDTLDDEGGKIPAVCENVKKIYDQFKEQKGTQLIFCDTGVPGKGKKYDAYSDIINRLVNDYGIPRKEIADIHEAGTDEKRKELFAKVNDGSVRILIGGTKNMGTGVNVQKRIVAMHHVDVPWTPADREQREGRGVRQGNEIARDFNDDNVDVYFYATEGSIDMYKYQLQETKGKLFAQFKSGTIGDRTFDEGDAEGDFDPAEVVAMLSGNPVIFEKSKQDKKVEKLRRAKRAYESDWQRRRSRYEELQQKKRNFERLLSLNASDVRDLERGGFTPDEEGKYPTTVTVSVKDDYSSRRTFDKPKEAGEYIHSLLKQGKKVQLTGFNQKANITVPITDAGLFGKPVAELDSYGGIKYTVEVSDDDTAAGVAFRNLLQKVYSNCKVYERNLEDVNNQLKGADPGENKFPKQAELDEALKEKKRLDDEYKKLSDEEPKADENKDGGLRFREDDARDVAQSMDDNNGTEIVRFIDFLRRGRLEQGESRYFHVGETGDILNEHGISGKITIGTSAVNSHHNEDTDHLDENDWVEVIEKLNEPVAITEYGDRGNSFRIYTIVEKNGKNICVGVDVNSVGRDVNITNIRTAFARDIANALNERLVYPHSRTELETAIRELSLRHNREVYPEQPYDAANIRNNSETQAQNEENLLYRVREDEPPTKTQKVYKLMRLGEDGRLYPLFIDATSPTELGVWYNADSPNLDILQKMPSGTYLVDYENDTYTSLEDYAKEHGFKAGKYPPKDAINEATAKGLRWVQIEDTEKGQRRYGGESRKYWNLGINGSGSVSTFAMRPGWHAGSLPSMRQIGKGKDRNLRDDSFVWVEGEVSADVNYQQEADRNPDKDIPTHIPENGYYLKATNANATASQADRIGWYVAGAFKANRIISDAEAQSIIDEYNAQHPESPVEYDFERESGKPFTEEQAQDANERNAGRNRDGENELPQQSSRVYTAKERREHEAYAERQWRRAHEVANEIIEKLNISDDITVYESIDEVPGSEDFSAKRRRSKGWYDLRTNKIVVVLGNHRSPNDVLQTILHEAVAHYGLRKLFGKNFETFLDNVYKYADMDVRRRIINMAANKGWDIREATEEYLASLAEDTDFDNAENRSWAGHWFNKIKQLFLDMLHHIGLRDYDGVSLSDNELRYILWRSYKNLAEPGHYRNYFSIAEDTVMQSNMHVGDFAEETGETIEQTTKVAESGLMFRDGDFTPRDRTIARDIYERMVSTGGYQFQEAVQDSMLGLKRLYQSILGKGTRMEDVDGFENAYLAENRMSSVNAAEQHEYYVRFMKPLLKAISDIAGANNGKRQELTDYMMAKHGLERNVVMAQRDFDAYQQQYPKGTKTLDDFRERDYAGLTALTGEDDVAMAELTAQQMVDNYEQDNDTTELWKRVNDATAATLAKIYSSGLLSKERYEQIQKMFEYYIPLQGWDETTSDEVYGYLTSKNGPLGGSPIKHAKGRSSKADDPIATIALMADDAIRQGNRNKMKQTFLNFVLNHQSDLVSVNDLWLQYNAAMDEWEAVFADIENSDTAADVERKVEAFEERMQQLAESDPDNYKRGRDTQNIPYKVVKDNLKEHQVLVRRNGRTYVLTINGNPRAAQALNGLTNPDVETGGVVGNLMQGAQWINRNLSAFYTTRNPDFVASNFFRDMLYSNCMTWVKESPKYALRFHKNFGRVNPARMRILLGKWEDGTLDESNYIENLFKQFMLNGGETGYTNIKDIDGHKREIAAELKRNGSNARKAWQWLGEQLDLLNGSAENCARFAAFVTSREDGRSIERSIYDAKEISVNFNKKGSGGKMVNATGQTLFGKVGSYVGGGGRLLYVFWNAGVQGTTNFARAAKRNPIKATAGAASMFMLGAVIPFLAQAMGGDDDDDKNAYYNLPEYVRRSNIIINAGNQWIAIPLPIEFRAFYGLGELATGVITGNERYSDSELAFQMGSQVSQILPLDMLEGGGGINPFIPSSAKPFVEAYMMNKSWTGLPVYKDSPWNKNNPEWTKAYKSANSYLVSGAKWLNEISGGDDYKKGFIDINPAKVEYLLSGMFGGAFTTGDKLMKMGETIFSDREFDWRNMLIANRVVKTGDERTANRKLSNEYFKYKDEYEETKRLLKKYSDEAATNERYKHRLERLQQSEEYLLYDVFDNYQPILKNLHDAKDGADETTLKSIESEENTLRRDMVDLMHAIEDGMKPDINAHVDAMLKREFEAGGLTQKPAGSRIAKRLGGTDSYGSPQNEYGQVYLQMRDYIDLAEDVTLQAALKKAKESGDADRAKDIESARRQITEVKKDLTEVPYTLSDGTVVTAIDIMQELRDLRKSLMSELGITTQQQPNR